MYSELLKKKTRSRLPWAEKGGGFDLMRKVLMSNRLNMKSTLTTRQNHRRYGVWKPTSDLWMVLTTAPQWVTTPAVVNGENAERHWRLTD